MRGVRAVQFRPQRGRVGLEGRKVLIPRLPACAQLSAAPEVDSDLRAEVEGLVDPVRDHAVDVRCPYWVLRVGRDDRLTPLDERRRRQARNRIALHAIGLMVCHQPDAWIAVILILRLEPELVLDERKSCQGYLFVEIEEIFLLPILEDLVSHPDAHAESESDAGHEFIEPVTRDRMLRLGGIAQPPDDLFSEWKTVRHHANTGMALQV